VAVVGLTANGSSVASVWPLATGIFGRRRAREVPAVTLPLALPSTVTPAAVVSVAIRPRPASERAHQMAATTAAAAAAQCM